MRSIWDEYFFEYCSDKGFNKKAFIKKILKLKGDGVKQHKGTISGTVSPSYFDSYLRVLNSLTHSFKYYSNESYRKNKKDHPKCNSYNARICSYIFKKHPYLNNLELLTELKRFVLEERAIQKKLEHWVPKSPRPKLLNIEEVINLISSQPWKSSMAGTSFKDEVEIKYYHGVYFIESALSECFGFFHKEELDMLLENNLLRHTPNNYSFRISIHFPENLLIFKKKKIQSKMTTAFSNE